MANITKIKATDAKEAEKVTTEKPKEIIKINSTKSKKASAKANKKALKAAEKAEKKANKAQEKAIVKNERKGAAGTKESKKNKDGKKAKKVFILFRPFVALGRGIANSWREIRQVRWPNRKTTWKMVFAVFIYSALVIIFVTLVDVLLNFIFDVILK